MGPRLKLPKYVHGFLDRHGVPRFYYRRPGFAAVKLPGLPYPPEFMASYTSDSDTYVQFDWDQHLLGAPGPRPQCTGVQHFPSNPHPYLP